MVVDSMLAVSAVPDESHHDMQDNDSELSEGDDLRVREPCFLQYPKTQVC
jgi:hypothetical protein